MYVYIYIHMIYTIHSRCVHIIYVYLQRLHLFSLPTSTTFTTFTEPLSFNLESAQRHRFMVGSGSPWDFWKYLGTGARLCHTRSLLPTWHGETLGREFVETNIFCCKRGPGIISVLGCFGRWSSWEKRVVHVVTFFGWVGGFFFLVVLEDGNTN